MSKVFVLDTNKRTLNPVHPGRARILLSSGKAAVFKRYPFTLILKQEIAHPHVQALRVKIDPGSKTTGIALVSGTELIFAAELSHRGSTVKKALDRRRAIRRGRRSRHTRYRKPRFHNRARHKGWVPPSLRSRIGNIITWVQRLTRSALISDISMELVKFDT
jgi:RRXRR protein